MAALNMTKIDAALTKLTTWIKDGLKTKQNNVLVKNTDPLPAEGKDGDVCIVVDT